MQGKVHSIDTFSTLDGPGIRLVVFLQGCHLRCLYCHNPDTWDPRSVSAKNCSPEELMGWIRRGQSYYQASGGGLTFSGGEPLLQHGFVREVFKRCQAEGIHTAVDSSLYVPHSRVASILPFTDLVLADIKHINSEQSQAITGQGNDLNLSNLNVINDHGVAIWIRYVVVPGFTDSQTDVAAMASFVAQLDSVARIDLLSYHTLGRHKWQILNKPYALDDVQPPSLNEMQDLHCLVKAISHKPVYIS